MDYPKPYTDSLTTTPNQIREAYGLSTVPLFAAYTPSTAILSPFGNYRYRLTRSWGDGPCVTWLMLNPSTATAETDDPTIRRCVGFSRLWGFGRLIVVNLFALRATDPRELAKAADPIGPDNDRHILAAVDESTSVVCAWGCQQHLKGKLLGARPANVLRMIEPRAQLGCLGYRADRAPRHPLMLSYSTKLEVFGTADLR